MNDKTLLAQATQAPNSGASNAEDFQPLTQNPQTAPTNLQPGTVPQSTSTQDILNTQNVRISVPVSSGEPSFSAVEPVPAGINWSVVIIATVAIVVVVEALLRARARRGGIPVVSDPLPVYEEVPQPATPIGEGQHTSQNASSPSKRPKKHRKSKSKRKRK